nr:hypothetical protein [Bdellovibrio sp. KM01]
MLAFKLIEVHEVKHHQLTSSRRGIKLLAQGYKFNFVFFEKIQEAAKILNGS